MRALVYVVTVLCLVASSAMMAAACVTDLDCHSTDCCAVTSCTTAAAPNCAAVACLALAPTATCKCNAGNSTCYVARLPLSPPPPPPASSVAVGGGGGMRCTRDADCNPAGCCSDKCQLAPAPDCTRIACAAMYCPPSATDCGPGSCTCNVATGTCGFTRYTRSPPSTSTPTPVPPIATMPVFPGRCTRDADCNPDGCCHPKTCSMGPSATCSGACTAMCEPGTMDCGQGSCMCDVATGQCGVAWLDLHPPSHSSSAPTETTSSVTMPLYAFAIIVAVAACALLGLLLAFVRWVCGPCAGAGSGDVSGPFAQPCPVPGTPAVQVVGSPLGGPKSVLEVEPTFDNAAVFASQLPGVPIQQPHQ